MQKLLDDLVKSLNSDEADSIQERDEGTLAFMSISSLFCCVWKNDFQVIVAWSINYMVGILEYQVCFASREKAIKTC